MTGTIDGIIVRSFERNLKSAPATMQREARCMTVSWETSEYEKTQMSIRSLRMRRSRSSSGTIRMPLG